MASSSASLAGSTASDLLRSSTSGFTGIPLRTLGRAGLVLKKRDLTVSAKLRKRKKYEYPWPANPDLNVKGGVLIHLSPFKPLKEKPKPVTLDFEKPLVDLQKKLIEVRKMANETGLDFSDQILSLETKYNQALKDLYTHLTPIQRVYIARHPNRPTFLDHVFNITEKFMELHGDREGYDDPAIVTGIGTIDGKSYMFIGHQKGRNTKENIKRNFGMPTPHGYRKALRLMEYADHHGFPIVTFIDTPGAYADLKSEELGQGEAIAHNLRSMFGLKVPIVSIVIGEGGSGGALAIACGNKLLMLENAVFYVASPEACAAILWKSSKAAPKAAEKLKITAPELAKLQIADGIIPEPLGGAHADPQWTSQQIKIAIKQAMDELTKMNTEDLLRDRMLKYRKIGGFQEGAPADPKRNFSMKKKDPPVATKIADPKRNFSMKKKDPPVATKIEKLKQKNLEGKESSSEPSKLNLDEMIKKLKREVDREFSEAVKAMGLTDRLSKLREEVSKASSDNQTIDPLLKDKIEKLKEEFDQGLSGAPNSSKLQKKRDMLKKLEGKKSSSKPSKLNLDEMIKKLKREVDREFSEAVKAMGLTDRVSKLREEVSKASSDNQTIDPLLKDKIEKLKEEFDQGLSGAPNSSKLQKKRDMLKELSKAKLELDRNKEAATLKQELKKKFDEVMNIPKIKENYEALQAEIQRVGASSPSDLDDELKKKIIEFNKEVDSQLVNAMKSAGLDVEFVKHGNTSSVPESEIEELNKDVKKEIEIVANSSSDIKNKIEQLKLEVAKAGETPDSESKNRIDALVQQIKQSLAEAVDSSSLKEKYENLVSKVSSESGTSGSLGDGLTDDELREKIGANCTFS